MLVVGDLNISSLILLNINLTYNDHVLDMVNIFLKYMDVNQYSNIKNGGNRMLNAVISNILKVTCNVTNGLVLNSHYHPALIINVEFNSRIKYKTSKKIEIILGNPIISYCTMY